jgi:endonuclease/exonuclease/phosphatase (EEP) superfamily protein YafD
VDRAAAMVLAALEASLLATPLLLAAPIVDRETRGDAAPSRLKLIAFNIGFDAGPLESLADLIDKEKPDLVMLEEVPRGAVALLRGRLASEFPHTRTCPENKSCLVALLSRLPLSEGGVVITGKEPAMAYGYIEPVPGKKVAAMAVHLDWPLNPDGQVKEVAGFVQMARVVRTPLIVGGDFNLTPWSNKLQSLCRGAGLRMNAMWRATWPTDGQFYLPRPTFLIDHVLTTPDIKSVSFEVGPDLGSDHLPIIAVVELP